MTCQPNQLFINSGSVGKNRNLGHKPCLIHISAQQRRQPLAQFFPVFLNHIRRTFFDLTAQKLNCIELTQHIVFQTLAFAHPHRRQLIECCIQRTNKQLTNRIQRIAQFLHRPLISARKLRIHTNLPRIGAMIHIIDEYINMPAGKPSRHAAAYRIIQKSDRSCQSE